MNKSAEIFKALYDEIRLEPKFPFRKPLLGESKNQQQLGRIRKGKSTMTPAYAEGIAHWVFERLRELDQNARVIVNKTLSEAVEKIVPTPTVTFLNKDEFAFFLTDLIAKQDGRTPLSGTGHSGSEYGAFKTNEFSLEEWRVEVLRQISILEGTLRTFVTNHGGKHGTIKAAIAHGFISRVLHRIAEDLNGCCYAANSEKRKELVMNFTPDAKKSICTVSYWDRELWKDHEYTDIYLQLVSERDVEVRRIFVYDTDDGVQELCRKLKVKPHEKRIGTLDAIAINRTDLRAYHHRELKSLWLMDEHYGTRSLPYFDRDERTSKIYDNDGQVFWGEAAKTEKAWFNAFWKAYPRRP